MLVAACGKPENGPRMLSLLGNSALKAVSTDFSERGVVDEDGKYSSLAVYGWGYPAVAYIGDTSGSLYYTEWNGSGWDTEVQIDSAQHCVSLAFDSSGRPSIAYYDSGAIMWAYDADGDGEWDDDEDWPMEIHPDVGDWSYDVVYGDGARHLSHDIAGNCFGFAFYDENDGDLVYFEYNIVTSSTSEVDPDTSGDVGRFCSLQFSGYTPTVSYYDADNERLKFAKENSPYWDVEVVDDFSGDSVGKFSDLSGRSSSVPTIAYYVEHWDEYDIKVDGDPYLAVWNPATSEWDIERLDDSEDDYGQWISHDWDPITGTKAGFSFMFSQPSIWPDKQLKFILYDGEDYTLNTPDGDWGGKYTSFVWEDDEIGWISHYEEFFPPRPGDQDLRYVMVDDS